jgi:Adenylate and Guanylate cyclase catalytic domain
MGSSTSKYQEDIGAADIAEFVASLGNNFKPYEDDIRKAGIKGRELAIMSDEELEQVFDSVSVVNRLHRRKLASVCRKHLKKNPDGDCDTSSTSSSSSNRMNFSSVPRPPPVARLQSAGARTGEVPGPPSLTRFLSAGARSAIGTEESSLAGSVGTSSSPLARASSPVPPPGPALPMPGQFENMCVAQSFEALSLLVNMENQKRLLTQDNRPKGPPENMAAIVLTDVQGSTSLWEADPKAMRSALNTHDEIIRGLRADHGGYEIDTEGTLGWYFG